LFHSLCCSEKNIMYGSMQGISNISPGTLAPSNLTGITSPPFKSPPPKNLFPVGPNSTWGGPNYETDMMYELQRRDSVIIHQHNRILQLEEELILYNKQIERLILQVAKQTKISDTNKPKQKTNQTRYWTAEEHQRFLDALKMYGVKEVKAIAAHVGTRSSTQVRTHAQKYFLKLDREKKSPTDETQKEKDYEPLSEDEDAIEPKKRKLSIEQLSPTLLASPVAQQQKHDKGPTLQTDQQLNSEIPIPQPKGPLPDLNQLTGQLDIQPQITPEQPRIPQKQTSTNLTMTLEGLASSISLFEQETTETTEKTFLV